MRAPFALACALAAVPGALAFDAGLRDSAIGADSVSYLDGTWSLSSIGTTIEGDVPGDLMTDLQVAGVIDDPLYELNWLQQSDVVWGRDWTYSTAFTLSASDLTCLQGPGCDILLVFDGIKMGARVAINGVQVLSVWDQFLRYNVSLATAARSQGVSFSSSNNLTVTFDQKADPGDEGRWMACSGGWDWAAYSNTFASSPGGTSNTFSRGIWRSVYLARVSTAALTYVVPLTYYTGPYPTTPLVEGAFSPFNVVVTTHMYAPAATSGTLTVVGEWGASTGALPVSVPAGTSSVTVNLTATAAQVQLWWPAGVGAQPLYNVSAIWTPASGPAVSLGSRIGFRTVYLSTGNDTDPNYVAANATADGTSDSGMFFRVNGGAVWARGGNMIPTDELEGRYSAAAHRQIVRNAVDGGMNMVRVWGGGVFLPKAFYDATDELGVLVYHDMQYAQGGHSPTVTVTQEAEFRHNIRRLASHPSIAIYDGCNECHVVLNTSTGIYATFVLTVVVQEDASRVVWPSCPSNGWVAGVNRLTALPNGSPLGLLPSAKPPAIARTAFDIDAEWGTAIETHGPYQHGGGFPAVNGNQKDGWFNPGLPVPMRNNPGKIGLGQPNVFASEFGCSVYSSFYSMSPTLDPAHWGIQGGAPPDTCVGGFQSGCTGPNVMAQRNYPCNSLIVSYFGPQEAAAFNDTGAGIFAKHLWQCMLSQALNMHANIMDRRQQNQFGTIVWQLGEIWPTGGWGSIEYATVGFTPGQVLGGRWKPLHHWYDSSLFRDQFVGCGSAGAGKQACFARHDGTQPFKGTALVTAVGLSTGLTTLLASVPLDLPAGPGQIVYFSLPSAVDPAHTVLTGVVKDSTGAMVSSNIIPLTNPGNMTLPPAAVQATVAPSPNPDGTVSITVTTNATALWVTLSSLAQGRFTPNVFLLPPSPGTQAVTFLPVPGTGPVDMGLLSSSLRVEHANMYAAGNWEREGRKDVY